MLAMLRFEPEYKNVTWGGWRLTEEFGRAIPEGPIGESWELVELEGHHSTVQDGPRAGKKLGDLWRAGDVGGAVLSGAYRYGGVMALIAIMVGATDD